MELLKRMIRGGFEAEKGVEMFYRNGAKFLKMRQVDVTNVQRRVVR